MSRVTETWAVVKIRVPFWVPMIIRHLRFRVSKKDLNFDNYPHDQRAQTTGKYEAHNRGMMLSTC